MVDTSASSASLTQRMIRAARLDSSVYEDVEADTSATSQAAIVVVITTVAQAIGSAIGAAMSGDSSGLIGGIVTGLVGNLIGWVIWAYITYFIGTRIFNGTATPGELLRTIGFSYSPGVLYILSFIPGLGGLISFVVYLWVLVAGVVAVRQALDFDTGKAILTTVIGWLIPLILIGVLGVLGFGAVMALGGAR